MAAMRQRLLLVAGWIVAAVGAGVVASGAVAVAGGQVFDRPIRPLNATEVAALPVDETVAALASSIRQASGGSQAGEGVTDEGDGRDTAGTSGSEHPAGPGGVPAGVAEPGSPDFDLPTAPPKVTTVSGGSASITTVGDPQILWATPRPGYAVAFQFDADYQITVTFTSDDHRSTILVGRLPGGEITVDTGEEAIR
ncbi:MAG: hypothetical protein BMS9Abin07_1967 [Acidimicrobiia bacterium]|nr:MAG: hypothetical protein BMS9Abin07_1967 [Acidimicrobiia bacterium]